MQSQLGRFEHGGDMYDHVGAIDFSANINPLGMPPQVPRAVCEHVNEFDAYPDAACHDLRRAIAEAEGVPVGHVVCTAGASDLITRVCNVFAPETALVTAPCFSEYERAIERAGGTVERHMLRDDEDFAVTARILQEDLLARTAPSHPRHAAASSRDLVFLCSPNNPTGLTIARDVIEGVLEASVRAGVVVVLDECFLDFTGERTAVDLCERYPNLVVMRAFTKMYAMAGFRLGYGICSDADVIARIEDAGEMWAVSTPAQVAGIAALEEAGWVERTRSYVGRARTVLAAGMRELGLRVIPGEANYLLFQSARPLYEPLLQRGFVIRRCGNYVGLDESWYRVAVRTESENAALLAALKEVCS